MVEMKMLVDDLDLLDLMMKDMASQKSIYSPGPYWLSYTKRAKLAIKRLGINNFRHHKSIAMSGSYTDALNLDPLAYWKGGSLILRCLERIVNSHIGNRLFTDRFDRIINQQDQQIRLYRDFYMNHRFLEWFEKIQEQYDLPESMVGGAENVVNFGGKIYSLFYIECIARIYNYSSRVDFTKVDSVFEIGGGFGANAHLLMHIFPNIRKYIYLDIPPNLYIGTQYLKCFFPGIVDYKQSRDRERIEFLDNGEREILIIAPWQIERINATFDCVWNSHSFVEMPVNVVQNYAKYINQSMRKKPSSFLCMLTYDNFNLSTTLHPEKLLEIFDEFLTIEKIDQLVNLQELENTIPYYFLGRIAK